MGPQETSFPVKKVYQDSYLFLKNNPIYFYPYLILIFLEVLSILVLFLAPQNPLRLVFGPQIRTFWGERFLHYPFNFLLLPKLASYARTALAVIFGSLLTAMAVAMASDGFNNKKLNLGRSFIVALKKYLFIFIVIFVLNLGFHFARKIVPIGLFKYFVAGHTRLLFIGSKWWLGPIAIGINFLLAVFIQALFIYIIPVFIIENKKFLSSLGMAFGFFFRLFKSTLILVLLPTLLYIPIIILSFNGAFLMNKFFPEIVLLLEFLGTLLINLIIDPVITLSTTRLYLNKRQGH